jgi:hypothetical protein
LQSVLPRPLFWAIAVIGFWGGCLLQPDLHVGGVAAESMIPLVFLLLFVACEYLYELPVKLRQGILLLVAVEFFIVRGTHLVLLGTGHFFPFDNNLFLKKWMLIVFARDLIGTFWPGFFMAAVAFSVLLVIGLKASASRQEMRS